MNYLNTPYPMIHFRKVRNQKIYVDKSMMISRLNRLIGTNDCYVCITRPRRFGKTTNANMLGAYYTKDLDSHALFDQLSIAADQTQYLKFIKSLLKDQPYVELAYMTGILPIAKYSSGSELNMFREYNFMNDYIYEAFFGLSEEEVRKLCEENKCVSYEELKYWYDGYYLKIK